VILVLKNFRTEIYSHAELAVKQLSRFHCQNKVAFKLNHLITMSGEMLRLSQALLGTWLSG